jgi:hypothetical protein
LFLVLTLSSNIAVFLIQSFSVQAAEAKKAEAPAPGTSFFFIALSQCSFSICFILNVGHAHFSLSLQRQSHHQQ